ncbi:MAG: L-2,4-diaminobutyrate decarboxylase, partial [Bacteroidia bacterium]|nr:L-2,4-diaminobutyrate decarboxylase [Bacteroidia bacterium]
DLGFHLGPTPDLSVSYFWYPTSKVIDTNVFNKKLNMIIQNNGKIFLSSTVINDLFVIRIALLSFRTKKDTIDNAIDTIADSLVKAKAHFKLPL